MAPAPASRAFESFDRGDHAVLDDDRLSDAGVREALRQAKSLAHVVPLDVRRSSLAPASRRCEPVAEKGSLVQHVDAECAKRAQHRAGERALGARASGLGDLHGGGVGLMQPDRIGEPERAGEECRGHALGAKGFEHRPELREAAGDEAVGMSVDPGNLAEREGDDSPPLTTRFGRHSRRQEAGAAHQPERPLHGNSGSRTASPRWSRMIRSISRAMASERRSSASASSTSPVARACCDARIR